MNSNDSFAEPLWVLVDQSLEHRRSNCFKLSYREKKLRQLSVSFSKSSTVPKASYGFRRVTEHPLGVFISLRVSLPVNFGDIAFKLKELESIKA